MRSLWHPPFWQFHNSWLEIIQTPEEEHHLLFYLNYNLSYVPRFCNICFWDAVIFLKRSLFQNMYFEHTCKLTSTSPWIWQLNSLHRCAYQTWSQSWGRTVTSIMLSLELFSIFDSKFTLTKWFTQFLTPTTDFSIFLTPCIEPLNVPEPIQDLSQKQTK